MIRPKRIHKKSPPITTPILALLVALLAAPGTAQDYQLPFKGEDLEPGERIHTGDHAQGPQGEGEDFGALRYLGNGSWNPHEEGKEGHENSDFVVYNLPVYAITDGTIVGCWRNAPENPKPPAHHRKFTEGFIPGGGNMLFVDQSDGTRALYAHMIPGSIPAALCPNDEPLFPWKMTIPEGDAFVMLEEADQVAITKGDFLGRIGNSGSSSGPHLHLHAEESGAASVMIFAQGLYKPYSEGSTEIQGGWASFAGSEIPDGRILIRPPRSNPYRMADFESYRLGSGRHYAGIFEPGVYAPVALLRTSWSQFLSDWQAIEKKGYRMKDFEAYEDGGIWTYAGIFEPGSHSPIALFKNNWKDFLAGWQAIEKEGYRIKDLEVYGTGSKLTYAGIFEPGNFGPMALFKNNWKDFLAGWQAIEKKGYRMKDLEVYGASSKLTYAGIFEPGSHAPVALFKNNWKDFLTGWQAIEKKGYRMKDLEVYQDGYGVTYAGIFEPGNYGPAALFLNDWADFLEGWQHLE